MRRVDVLIGALSQLTGRDEEAVAQTFEAIISSNPDKGKDLLAEIPSARLRPCAKGSSRTAPMCWPAL